MRAVTKLTQTKECVFLMKTGKKILSIVLALLLMTTTCSSALVASACMANNHDAYKEASDLLDLIDEKLDAYNVDIDGTLDGLVNGKDLLNKVDGMINEEALNGYIEGYISGYLENGQWLLDMGNEKVVELLNQYLQVSKTDGYLDNLDEYLTTVLELLPELSEIDEMVLTALAENLGVSSVEDLKDMLPTVAELDKMVDDAVGQYLNDGTKLVELLDGLIQQLLDAKVGLQYTNGVLSGVNGELVNDEMLNGLIENYLGDYICDGKWLIDYADNYVNELINKYVSIDSLNEIIQTNVLADNSSIMQNIFSSLGSMLPVDNSQGATYEGLIKGLIPILSCLSLDNIMGGDFTVASPSAFYYLAGLDVDESGTKLPYVVENSDGSLVTYDSYFDYVNSVLSGYGITSRVSPIINLTAEQANELLGYVQLEKAGGTLQDIKAAGFDWTEYVPSDKAIEVANTLIKIDLGDAQKLGAIIETLAGGATEFNPGADLAYILVDLITDLKTDPVRTLLKKLGSSQFSELIVFVVGIAEGLFGVDYKTYDLYMEGIVQDADGNYYDYVEVSYDEEGNPVLSYKHGGLDNYLDTIDSAAKLLNGLWNDIQANGEDLLKTLLVTRIDKLEDLLNKAVEMIVKMGLSKADKLNDQIYADRILIDINNKAIASYNEQIVVQQQVLADYQALRTELLQNIEQAKIDKAVEYELLPEGTASYDENTVLAAIDAKSSELNAEISRLETEKASIQAEYDAVSEEKTQLEDQMTSIDEEQGAFIDDTIYALADMSDIQSADFISEFNRLFNYRYDDSGDIVATSWNEWFLREDVQGYIADEDLDSLAATLEDEYRYAVQDKMYELVEEKEARLAELEEELAPYNEAIEEAENKIDELNNKALNEINAAGDAVKIFTGGDPNDPTNFADLAQLDDMISIAANAIEAIRVNDIAPLEADNSAKYADIEQCEKDLENVDTVGYEQELKDFKNIVTNLCAFIRGNGADDNLYNYYAENGLVGAVLSQGRLGYLEELLGSVINLFNYFTVEIDGQVITDTSALQDVVDILFADVLNGLYEDFIADPVGAVASRISGIASIVDKVYDIGLFRDYIDQFRPLINDVKGIFDDEFNTTWKTNKAGALLSSIPELLKTLDDAMEVEFIANALAPYSDIVDLVKYLLSEQFYNELHEAPLEYILSDETLGKLFGTDGTDGLVGNLLGMFIKDESTLNGYMAIVADAYNNVLTDLYHDFLTNPVKALADRINPIVEIVNKVEQVLPEDAKEVVEGFRPLINDLQSIFDSNFSADWTQSKVTAIADRLPGVVKLIGDALDNETLMGLITSNLSAYAEIVNRVKADYPQIAAQLNNVFGNIIDDYNNNSLKAVIDRVPSILDLVSVIAGDSKLIDEILKIEALAANETVSDLTPAIKLLCASIGDYTGYLKNIVTMDTVDKFFESPVYAVVGVIPDALGLVSSVTSNSELIDAVLNTNLVGSMVIGEYEIADLAPLIKLVCKDFAAWVAPIEALLNEQFLNSYSADKLSALLGAISPVLDLVEAILSDADLVNAVLAFEPVAEVLGDYTDLIEAVLANFSSIKPVLEEAIDTMMSQWNTSKTKAIISIIPYLEELVDTLVSIPETAKAIQPFKNTIEVLMKVLPTITTKGNKIVIGFLGDTPIDAILDQTFITQLESAASEITPYIADGQYFDLVFSVCDALDGLLFHLKNSDLIYTVQRLVGRLGKVVNEAEKAGVFVDVIKQYRPLINAVLKTFDSKLHNEFFASPVGAILSRLPQLKVIIKEVLKIDAIKNIEVAGVKISTFLPMVDTLYNVIDDNFYADYKKSPMMAVLNRATYIRTLAEQILGTGLLDSLEFYGFKIAGAVKVVLPLLSDNEIYDDFCKSVIGTFISSKRLGTVCSVLKNAIAYIDIFASGVNNGLYQLIDGLYGVLNGLYEDLQLSSTNVANRTSRVIINRLPAIQNLCHKLGGLIGDDKLINLTAALSDAPAVFKTKILDAVEGVDMISPYYYGISDILDALSEYLGEGNYNTLTTAVSSLNEMGPKLIPILEDALSVSNVEWSDLSVPKCNYRGTAEDYLVELSGQLGQGILTPLVETLAGAALTIPAVKDLVGDIQVTDLAGLLNDLLEFDFRNDELDFDAFNTEHLLITGVNLLLPKTAAQASADTADQVILVVTMLGVGAAAAFGVVATVRRRKNDCD